MKPEQREYPKYNPGQVLTDKDLNCSFNYLNEQTRLSRLSIGCGIIEGLTFSISEEKDVISIQSGKAVAPDGSLIIVPKQVEFSLSSLLAKYKIPRSVNYQIYLKETVVSEEEVYGDLQSGDIKSTTNRSILSVELDKNLQPCTIETSLMPRLDLSAPYKVPVPVLWNLDLKELRKTMMQNFYACRDVLVSNINSMISFIESYSPSVRHYFFKEQYLINLKIVTREFAEMGKKKTEIPQHYLFFCEDLRQAIIEYVEAYNEFVETHDFPVISKKINGSVALGDRNDLSESVCYRMNFRNGRELDERVEAQTDLDKMFYRITMMIRSFIRNRRYENFDGDLIEEDDMKLYFIPTCSKAPLYQRAMPSYYRGRMMHRWWYYKKNPATKLSLFYEYTFYKIQQGDDLSAYDAVRVDGPYGIAVDVAYDQLTSSIRKFGLPITVKKAKLYKRTYDYRTKNVQNICDKLKRMSLREYQEFKMKLNITDFSYSDLPNLAEPEKFVKRFIRTTHTNYPCLLYGESGDSPVKDFEYISRLVENFPNDARLSDVVEFGKTLVLLHYNNRVVATVVCSDYEDYWK